MVPPYVQIQKKFAGGPRDIILLGVGGGGYDGLCKKIDFFKVSPFLIRP